MNKYLFLGLVSLFAACTENNKNTNETAEANTETIADKKIARDELLKNIEANNAAISGSFNPDSLIFICNGQAKMCEQFVKSQPVDSMAPVVLSYQAKAFRVLQQPEKAVGAYNHIIQSYPDYASLPEVMLIKGLILDQEIKDKQAAEKAYLGLIQKFPNHAFAKDAQALLTQLHMTDEELIKSFEAKNKGK